MNWDVHQNDIFSHCNVVRLVSQLLSLLIINVFNPSYTLIQTHQSSHQQQIHQQTSQLPILLNDPLIDDLPNITTNTNAFQSNQKQSIEINTNTDNPNQNLINNLNSINQQQFPISRFEINTNIIQQFQDQQTHSTTKPVCALLVFGILLFIFNVLVERASLYRALKPFIRPDYFIRLELSLYLIYAGLEICELISNFSNSNLVLHIFDYIFLFFKSRIESKIVYVFSQASTSSQPVWRMLLFGIIICNFIIWLFNSSLNGGLRLTIRINISPDDIKCPFLINAFYFTILIVVLIFCLFFVFFFKFVKNNKENKVKIKDR